MSLNKVFLIGNLGKDPELKHTQNGTAVVNLSVATTEKRIVQGSLEEHTEWHRVTVWGKTAEACAAHLAKGSKVHIEGKLQTREYEKNGEKRYATEIVAWNVLFLSFKPKSDEAPAAVSKSSGDWAGDDSDIPF